MDKLSKIIAAFVVVSVFFCTTNLFAQSMHGLDELALAEPYSEPYAGQALWFDKMWEDQGPYRSTAVRINDCWAIASGHSFLVNGYVYHSHVVGTGPNSIDDRGVEREIAEYHMHPSWEAGGGVWDGDRVDLAVMRFAEPLPGDDLEIGSLSLDEIFEYAGYGRPATPDLGLLPYDGERRGWDAKAHYWGGGGVSSKYVRSNFWPGELSMGGIGTGGGSGSGGFSSSGDLVALLVYVVNSPNYAGASYGVRLDLYKDWIESYTDDLSCLPPQPKISSFQKARPSWAVSRCRYGEPC